MLVQDDLLLFHSVWCRHLPEPVYRQSKDGGCSLEVGPKGLGRGVTLSLFAQGVTKHGSQTVRGEHFAVLNGWSCLFFLLNRQDQLGRLMTELFGPLFSAEEKPTMVIPVGVKRAG